MSGGMAMTFGLGSTPEVEYGGAPKLNRLTGEEEADPDPEAILLEGA